MTIDPVGWATAAFAREGLTPIPREELRRMTVTGFSVEAASEHGAARVTVSARYAGQDKYVQWDEAQRLANRLMDVLEKHGAQFEEITAREPNCAFDAFPPTDPEPLT